MRVLPLHHRALLGGGPQRHGPIVRARDPRVRRGERDALELTTARAGPEDELRVLSDFPKPTRPVPSHCHHALLALRRDAQDVALMSEQGVNVRHVVEGPHLEGPIRGRGEHLAGAIANREASHRASVRRKLVHLLRGSRVPDVDALVGTRGTQQVVLLGHRAAQQRRGAALRRRHRSAAASARVDNRGGRAGEPRPRARLDVPFGDAAVLGHRVARGIVRGERHARHRQLMPAAYVPPRVASCVFVVFVFDVGVGVERRRDDAVRNLPAHAARLGHRLVLEPVRQPVVAVHVSDVVLVVLLLRP